MKRPERGEVCSYFEELGIDREQGEWFCDHFDSNGWKVSGRAPMVDWKAAVRNWIRRIPKTQVKQIVATPLPEKRVLSEEEMEKTRQTWKELRQRLKPGPMEILSQATETEREQRVRLAELRKLGGTE